MADCSPDSSYSTMMTTGALLLGGSLHLHPGTKKIQGSSPMIFSISKFVGKTMEEKKNAQDPAPARVKIGTFGTLTENYENTGHVT